MHAIPVLLLTNRQVSELNACWNNVIRKLVITNGRVASLLPLGRLNVKHLITLSKINFYKRLLFTSDVFIHNMFCPFV